MRVLVAYGTKNGSTGEIAEMVGGTLRDDGFEVEVQPAGEVRSVEGYDAVILGGGLYAGRWPRAAGRFAKRFGPRLTGRPVWVFSSGPLDRSADEGDIPPTPFVAKRLTMLGARAHVTFGGALGEDARGFLAKAMVRNGKGGDFRNHERIEAWAGEISAALGGRPAAPGVVTART